MSDKECLYVDIGYYFDVEDKEWKKGSRKIRLNPDGTIDANWYNFSYKERKFFEERVNDPKYEPGWFTIDIFPEGFHLE